MIKVTVLIALMRLVVCANQPSYPYLGTGYDLRQGNPDGPSIYSAEMDPGLRPAVFVMRSSDKDGTCSSVECPSYARCTQLNSQITRRYVVDGSTWNNQYHNQMGDKMTFNLEGEDIWSSMPIEHLDAVREVQELVEKKKLSMITEEIWNLRATAQVTDIGDDPLSFDYVDELCVAFNASENDAEAFPKFFERWGTHIVNEVTLGYKEVTRYLIPSADFFEKGVKSILPPERVDNIKKGRSYTSSEISKILENFDRLFYGDQTFVLKFGDEKRPLTPLKIHLVSAFDIAGFLWCDYVETQDMVKLKFHSELKSYLMQYKN